MLMLVGVLFFLVYVAILVMLIYLMYLGIKALRIYIRDNEKKVTK